MKKNLLISSLLSVRNVSILVLCLIASGLILRIPALAGSSLLKAVIYSSCFAAYIALVIQSLSSKSFHEKTERKMKIDNIKELNYRAKRLFYDVRNTADNRHYLKMRKVMEDKNSIYESFFNGEYDPIKERILTQALNLTVSYISILKNYTIRLKELTEENTGEITERIRQNRLKSAYIKDPVALGDLNEAITMDEGTIERISAEKKELVGIDSKLDHIEGVVATFRHRMLSNIDSEDLLEKTENIINEASALSNAITEHRKHKLGARL